MSSQHKNPLIGWHSDDPTLKPWIKAEAGRLGITEKALLDEVLSEYRHGGKQSAAPAAGGGNRARKPRTAPASTFRPEQAPARKPAPKPAGNCTHSDFRGVKGVCPGCHQSVGYK